MQYVIPNIDESIDLITQILIYAYTDNGIDDIDIWVQHWIWFSQYLVQHWYWNFQYLDQYAHHLFPDKDSCLSADSSDQAWPCIPFQTPLFAELGMTIRDPNWSGSV